MENEKVLIQGRFTKFWALPWVLSGGGILLLLLGIKILNNRIYSDDVFGDIFAVLGPLLFLISIYTFVIYLAHMRCEITVTDKRVYGKARSGKRVDLPLDSISAIGTGLFKTVAVATSSGKIKFMLLENLDDVYRALNGLILQRQNATKTVVVSGQNDSADQLKKYKDLLDSGVITQEEFDAKKKQLLGL